MEDVHGLRVFRAVAEQLSFTRAAESLFLTQSAVSHQIARLERSLGATLLDRAGRRVALTPAGQVLARHARQVFAAMDEAAAAVRHAVRPDLGRLRVGASVGACQHIIPEALREFRECFPGYSLSILPGDTPEVVERLNDGAIDLGIVIRADGGRSALRYRDLFRDQLGFLVSRLHPWARAGRVDRRELADQHFVLYSRSSVTFRAVQRYLLRQDVPLRDWIELGSMEAIKELVKLGLGISVTARWIAREELKEQSLAWLPTPGATLRRTWSVATPAGKQLSVAEQTFIGLCEAVARRLDDERDDA